jgi:ABC-type antimicrobial peptide transport system permease subunit
MGAGVFVLLLIAVALAAPWIAPFDAENYFDYDRLNDGPSMMHWFGVDSLGRDIFSRVLVGAQISLAAGVLAVLLARRSVPCSVCWPGIMKAGGIASSCASATCCSPSRGSCWRLPW